MSRKETKNCNYTQNNYFLCEFSQRMPENLWLRTGHPCKFSSNQMIGTIKCMFETVKEKKLRDKGIPIEID
jgi:hypothetical protein